MSRGADPDDVFNRRLLIVLAVVLLLWAVSRLTDLVLVIVGAVLIGVALRAGAERLHGLTGLPVRWALGVTIVGLVALLFAAGWLFGSEVAAQVQVLREALPRAWESLQQRYGGSPLAEQLRAGVAEFGANGSMLLARVGTALFSVTSAATAALLIFVGAVYLAADPRPYQTGLLKLVPPDHRPLAKTALDETDRALRLWLLGQLVSMTVIGVLTGVGLALVGLPSALALGLLAGLLAFVPLVGPIVATIPALLLALAEGGATVGWTLAVILVVQQVEEQLVMPLVQQRMVDLPPALTLFAIVASGTLFGPLGVLLGAPLTVIVFVLVKRLYVREALGTPTPMPGE